MQQQLQELINEQTKLLESISRFSTEEAKNYLLSQLETEVVHEKAVKLRELEARYKEESEEIAQNITLRSKCAATMSPKLPYPWSPYRPTI